MDREICVKECGKFYTDIGYCQLYTCTKVKVSPREVVYYEWFCPICGSYNKHDKNKKIECTHCRMRFESK